MLELDGATLTYDSFCEVCLNANYPAIIRRAASSSHFFDTVRLETLLSPTGLYAAFGLKHRVPCYAVHKLQSCVGVTTCDDGHPVMDADDGCQQTHTLGEVFASWGRQAHARARATGEKVLYLKDWHMQQEMETLQPPNSTVPECTTSESSARWHGGDLYRVPSYLGMDWMDAFCTAVSARGASSQQVQPSDACVEEDGASLCGWGSGASDYRFAYIGPSGSWTPLHYDVFGTYSWSLNVCGDKLWFFPDQASNTYLTQNLVKGFPTPPDLRVLAGIQYWSVVQHPGDLVFVPSQYFHQVHNVSGKLMPLPLLPAPLCSGLEGGPMVSLTISINHNWCNEYCIEKMVKLFVEDSDWLSRMLTVQDMELVYGNDRNVWMAQAEDMLQKGSNWSYSCMRSFLRFCMQLCNNTSQKENVVVRLQRLLATVEDARARLFV